MEEFPVAPVAPDPSFDDVLFVPSLVDEFVDELHAAVAGDFSGHSGVEILPSSTRRLVEISRQPQAELVACLVIFHNPSKPLKGKSRDLAAAVAQLRSLAAGKRADTILRRFQSIRRPRVGSAMQAGRLYAGHSPSGLSGCRSPIFRRPRRQGARGGRVRFLGGRASSAGFSIQMTIRPACPDQKAQSGFCLIFPTADNACDFPCVVFIELFLAGVIDVIGRDFGAITFADRQLLFLLAFSGRVIDVIDVIGTFAFAGLASGCSRVASGHALYSMDCMVCRRTPA